MARKIHRGLDYEKEQLKRLKLRVPALSDMLYKLDDAFNKDWTDNHTWTYPSGINFKDLTKEEFTKVKRVLGLPELKKDISESGVTFKGEYIIASEVKWGREYKETLSIEFMWDLPDTCKIDYEEHLEEVRAEDVVITDGKVSLKKYKAVVNCGEKEMLKAVFKHRGGADA